MPVLASIYAVFLAFIAIASIPATIRHKEPVWYTALTFAADIIILGLFVSYWLPLPGGASGPVAVTLFMFSLLGFRIIWQRSRTRSTTQSMPTQNLADRALRRTAFFSQLVDQLLP